LWSKAVKNNDLVNYWYSGSKNYTVQ